jgi:hypothetical protein
MPSFKGLWYLGNVVTTGTRISEYRKYDTAIQNSKNTFVLCRFADKKTAEYT